MKLIHSIKLPQYKTLVQYYSDQYRLITLELLPGTWNEWKLFPLNKMEIEIIYNNPIYNKRSKSHILLLTQKDYKIGKSIISNLEINYFDSSSDDFINDLNIYVSEINIYF